jgi:acyl-coenzyme A synthetase/AMP-(fatty) acid ligase
LGLQVSSVDLERVCVRAVPAVHEAAAVGVPAPGGGPERLVLFVVLDKGVTGSHTSSSGSGRARADGSSEHVKALRSACQAAIRGQLNPLFKVDQVIVCEALPRTASNKVMRRTLRDGLRTPAQSRL